MEGEAAAGQGRPAKAFEFTFNRGRVSAFEGDTVATALYRSGIRVYSRSLKFRRPRGLYCGAGRCISCVMRVNGVPAVRTCATPALEGMTVETERGFPSAGTDLLSVFDHIFRRQFDYHSKFVRPAFMAPFYQWVVRRLTSSSHIPDSASSFPPMTRRSCDVLLIGRGMSGSVAQARLESAGVRSLVVADRRVGQQSGGPSTAFGFYESGEVGIQSGVGIQLVKAKAVILATGRYETGLVLVNGDLPGVMLPEAVHQLASRGISPGRRAVLVGENELRDKVVRELQAMGTGIEGDAHPDQVVKVLGRKRVSGVELRQKAGGTARVRCDTIVSLGPLVPAVGLAQQAGCELTCREGTWSVKVGNDGRTSVPGVFACGGVAGFLGKDERIASGETAALSAIRFRGGV